MIAHTPAPFDFLAQAGKRPCRQPGLLHVRSIQHDLTQLRHLRVVEPGLDARTRPVMQAVNALSVVAKHGISQRLPFHTGKPRCLGRVRPSSALAIACIRAAAARSGSRRASRRSSAADKSSRTTKRLPRISLTQNRSGRFESAPAASPEITSESVAVRAGMNCLYRSSRDYRAASTT